MATVSQPGYYNLQALTSLGALAAGYRLYTYSAGTTTHKVAYTDSAGSVAHSYTSDGVGGQYIALNARGELPAPLYLTSGSYDLCLKTSAGATVWTRQADPEGADLESSSGSANVGFIQSGTGAVARTAQAKMREIYSVLDFGAVGDGTTNDATAIQAAIDAASSGSKGAVYFPPGKYKCTSALTVPSLVRLVGAGSNNSSNVGTTPSEIYKGSAMTSAVVLITGDGVELENLSVNGQAGNTGDGVLITGARVSLRNVGVFNMGQDGIRIGSTTSSINANGFLLHNVKAKANTRHGLNITDKTHPTDPDANGGTVMGGDYQYNGECGIYSGHGWLNTFVGVLSQNNSTYGLYLDSRSYGNTIIGGDYESNTTKDIYVAATAFSNTILTGQAYSTSHMELNNDVCTSVWSNAIRAGEGITFPSGATASSDVNTLDAYQEGTWTPVVSGLSTAGAPSSYSVQVGKYTRIGNKISFYAKAAYTGHTGTGTMIVSLPYTSANTTGLQPICHVAADNLTFTGQLSGLIQPNVAYVTLIVTATGAPAAGVAMDTSCTIYVSGEYWV